MSHLAIFFYMSVEIYATVSDSTPTDLVYQLYVYSTLYEGRAGACWFL